jgi:hypothetical protein
MLIFPTGKPIPRSATAALLLVVNPLFATDDLQHGAVSGQIRFGAVSIDDNHNSAESITLGGKLSYKSPVYHGLRFTSSFYSTNPVAGYNRESLFLSSTNKAYSILGEAYLNTRFGNTAIKIGRQEIDTPFADTDDNGMVPNTFEAVMLTNNSLANTTITASHLHRWAGIDSDKPEKFTKLNEDKGINALGVRYEPSAKWQLQGWHYAAQNATDISYLESIFKPNNALQLGLQYTRQQGAAYDGNAWGASTEYVFHSTTIGLAYNNVTAGKVSNGFGGGPYFTSAEDHTIADMENQQATSLSLQYSGINRLTLGINYADFDKTENELDLSANYTLNKSLSLSLIHSDMYNDGTMTRGFIHYNF